MTRSGGQLPAPVTRPQGAISCRSSSIAPCPGLRIRRKRRPRSIRQCSWNSRVTSVSRYSEAGQSVHTGGLIGDGRRLRADFGQPFSAPNGGPEFRFNEAIRCRVNCDTQEEIDYYWDKLSKGGDPKRRRCAAGLIASWRVVAGSAGSHRRAFPGGRRSSNRQRAMEAILGMKKLDIRSCRARRGGRARHDRSVNGRVRRDPVHNWGFCRTRPRGPVGSRSPLIAESTEVVVTGAPRKRLVA